MFRLHFQMLASCFPINLEKEVTGAIKGDSSGEKFNQNVMIGATNDVFTLNKGLFRNVLVTATRGTKCIVSTLPGTHNVSLKTFSLSHPCVIHTQLASGRRLITIP